MRNVVVVPTVRNCSNFGHIVKVEPMVSSMDWVGV